MFVRNLLLALGALCLLGGIALSVVWYNAQAVRTAQRVEPQRPAALIATRDLAAGTLLRPDDMRFEELLPSDIGPAALLRGRITSAEFVGAVLRRPFAAGEQLAASDLLKPSDRQFLSAALKPGSRAVTITVDAPQSAAGLILPGDQVDVILTQTFGEADVGHKTVAETVLRNVRIIAVDQTLSTTGKPPQAPSRGVLGPETARLPKTVTFELSDREAERLFVAAQLGRLQLSVRPLEIIRVAAEIGPRVAGPTWAADVSPALGLLPRGPAAPGSPVEAAVRRPPPPSADPPEARP